MSLTVSKSAGGNFTPAPAGRFQGVCVDVVDEGMQPNPFKNNELQAKVSIAFQLDKMMDDGSRRFFISKWFTFSLDERASLAGFICDWLEISYSQIPDEFNLEELIGRNARLRIIQEPKKNNPAEMGSKIKSIEPWDENDGALMSPLNFTRKVDREDYAGPTTQAPQPVQQAQAPAPQSAPRAVPKPQAVAPGADPRSVNQLDTRKATAKALAKGYDKGAAEIDDVSIFDDDISDEKREEMLAAAHVAQPALIGAGTGAQAGYPAN